ncbi:uncharacterized protein LOC131146714 [Malania oleifera]|uniref:uncharacterized protein LOC131146714 n=1 Tax=Malania oleifera TaxID=397392 RepID=UPI0025ADBE3B|nr:uncharacterized protein LOC131146714 [Malania oleifera]
MVRARPIFSGSCMNRSPVRVRVRSKLKPASKAVKADQRTQFSGDAVAKNGSRNEKKILVVVDSSFEAKGALEWALSQAVQTQDTIILLYITKPSKQAAADSKKEINKRAYGVLYSMKNTCQVKRPGVQIEVAVVEGKEKGPTIVEEAKQRKVSLLVLGQRKKRSMIWRLRRLWGGNRRMNGKGGAGVVDFCIHNAHCMTIAVRRKNKKLGGYLITTKQHKNFWLLA